MNSLLTLTAPILPAQTRTATVLAPVSALGRTLVSPAQARHAHERTSDGFRFIPTSEIVDYAAPHGFRVASQSAVRSRDPERRAFAKHLIVLEHDDAHAAASKMKDATPRIGIINAHDGASRLRVFGGLYRMICANGMVVGDTWDDAAYTHRGDGHTLEDILGDVFGVVSRFASVADKVAAMKAVTLSQPERYALAEAASTLRWEDGAALMSPRELLTPRRSEDQGSDLWSTFNVVQEKLIKGGLGYNPVKRKSVKVRGINSVTADIEINRKLWDMAIKLAA